MDELSPQTTEAEPHTEAVEGQVGHRSGGLLGSRRLFYMFFLLSGVSAIILVTVLVKRPDDPLGYARTIGYGGVFLMGLIGSASPVWPLPGSWAAGLAAAFGLNPLLVGLAAGTGEAIGELSGYTAGYGGQITIDKWKRYAQIQKWMRKRGGLTIFVLSAIPNFFIKMATISAGALRYPVWRFFIFCWAGKTLKSLGFAAVGYAFSEWLIGIFEGGL